MTMFVTTFLFNSEMEGCVESFALWDTVFLNYSSAHFRLCSWSSIYFMLIENTVHYMHATYCRNSK